MAPFIDDSRCFFGDLPGYKMVILQLPTLNNQNRPSPGPSVSVPQGPQGPQQFKRSATARKARSRGSRRSARSPKSAASPKKTHTFATWKMAIEIDENGSHGILYIYYIYILYIYIYIILYILYIDILYYIYICIHVYPNSLFILKTIHMPYPLVN